MPLRWPNYSNSRSLLSIWESSANIVRRQAGLSSYKVMTQHKHQHCGCEPQCNLCWGVTRIAYNLNLVTNVIGSPKFGQSNEGRLST